MAPICTSAIMSVKPDRRATGELRMGERMRPQGQLWRDQELRLRPQNKSALSPPLPRPDP
eukprot:scaffold15553_cov129-Isochrysis_galbana.AAC.1